MLCPHLEVEELGPRLIPHVEEKPLTVGGAEAEGHLVMVGGAQSLLRLPALAKTLLSESVASIATATVREAGGS